jgi:hypothetical protein
MSVSYGGDSITFGDSSVQSSGFTGFKNKIINGAMVINQRATTLTDSGYITDRWVYNAGAASKASIAQSSTAPAGTGFTNSLLVTSSTALSVGASDVHLLEHRFEGYNVSDLGFGAAGAATVTLSFWIRSSLTGTFSGALGNAGPDRSYPFSYTIDAADTWEKKTITIPGDTTGTWAKTNTTAFRLCFALAVGSNYVGTANAWTGSSNIFGVTGAKNLLATNAATWYITGVQLERGSTASSFEFRSYSKELMMCQRYCVVWGPASTHIGLGTAYSSTAMNITVPVPVPMRTTPTPSKTTTGGNWLQTYVGSTATSSNSTPETGEAGQTAYRIYTPSSGTGWTGGQTTSWCQVLSGATFTLSAEL